MTTTQTKGPARRGRGFGALSQWMQRTMNTRAMKRIRRNGGPMMGMDVLILHTAGRRSAAPRQTPLARFTDGDDGWLVVASGGGRLHPDWYANLMARPEQAAVELHGADALPVRPHRLQGAERERAWRHVTRAQPRYGKYQAKAAREYPVVRLTPR